MPKKVNRHIFTSESVTEGHPDKVCDQISDAVLDELLRQDPQSHAGIEALATTGLVVVAGEIRTRGYVDIAKVARETIRDIGYTDHDSGFHWEDCGVIVAIDEQSPDIAQGVDVRKGKHKAQGAGDQGLMFGYATDQTPELMPLPIMLAHRLAKRLAEVRKSGLLPFLGPDGKTEVAVEHENGRPTRLHTVVIASQHDENASERRVAEGIRKHVVIPVCRRWLDDRTRQFINATGRFVKGGPPADTGLTGRKIIVDTYGGYGHHGGGCFSGKDPSKVDRSASYMARYVAKNIVAAKLAKQCEIQLAYVIGVADPISVFVDTKGTGILPDERLESMIRKNIDLTPRGIIRQLKLLRPIYRQTAAYGHFGRKEAGFTWERPTLVPVLRRLAARWL